jgi:hypothetical protein
MERREVNLCSTESEELKSITDSALGNSPLIIIEMTVLAINHIQNLESTTNKITISKYYLAELLSS